MIRIAHLVDDTGAGGVTRTLDFIASDPRMAFARHTIVPVRKNALTPPRVEADVIVSHLAVSWRALPGLMALRACHAGTPLVHVEHSYSEGFFAAKVSAKRRFLTLLRSAYALFDRVVAVSEAQAAWLRRRMLVSDAALVAVPPCVDLDPFRAVPRSEGGSRVIGAMGRFHEQKGFDVLIRAFRAVEDDTLRLRLMGDGPDRAALEALAAGDPRITIESFAADPAAALARCDAVAMPSRWEPFGLVALEARAAGRPVLATRVDGLIDQERDGVRTVAGQTVAAWTEALTELAGAATPMDRAEGREEETAERWRALIAGLIRPESGPETAVAA